MMDAFKKKGTLAAVVVALSLIGLLVLTQVDVAQENDASTAGSAFPRGELVIETAAGLLRLDVEIARSREQRAQGLMFRTALKTDSGMIFFYDPPSDISMWMKNTILSLDMIFIAQNGRITRIVANTTPMSVATISSRGAIRAVLELNAGAAKRLAIKPGDYVRLDDFSG